MATRIPAHVASTKDEDGDEKSDSHIHQKRLEETTSAYVLGWTDAGVTKTDVCGVSELQSCIQGDQNPTSHLFVFRGLPGDVFLALKKLADIDSSFIEAHAGRRRYRPHRTSKAAWAHFDYPELVHRPPGLETERWKAASGDLIGGSPTCATSAAGDGVSFCRASAWLSEKAQILCLDRPAWENPGSEVSRRQYKAYTAEKLPDDNGISTLMMRIDPRGNVTALGDEIPNLETLLRDGLQDVCIGLPDLPELLEELVIGKWDDFFEMLDLDLSLEPAETTALFSQALGCLERNLNVSRQRRKTSRWSVDLRPDAHPRRDTESQTTATTMEWEALLSRLSRHAQLSAHLRPVVVNVEVPPVAAAAAADVGVLSSAGDVKPGHGSRDSRERHGICDTGRKKNKKNRNKMVRGGGGGDDEDENQRSVNRVAYLGGVLLPFSVVSGILAIEDPYGPGDRYFWIFWAVTVPLALVTLAVIYADSIRKAEVWIEVASSGASDDDDGDDNNNNNNTTAGESSSGSDSSGLFAAVPVSMPIPDVEQAVPVTGRMAETISFSLPVNDQGEGEGENGNGDGDTDSGEGGEEEPDTMIEKRWWKGGWPPSAKTGRGRDRRKMKWRKEELGWFGAFATVFRVYKMKRGVPPARLRRR